LSLEVFRSVWLKKLTRFELARVIGARALQLALGAPPLVDVNEVPVKDPVAIAIVELLRGVLPMTIKRVTPDGKRILLPVNQLLSPDNKRYLESIIKSWTVSASTWSSER